MQKLELKNYQKEGVSWLKLKRMRLLADDMGIGKSAQAITAADELNCRRILIVCPPVARITWVREFEKWASISRRIKILKHLDDKFDGNDEVLVCSFNYASQNFAALHYQCFDLLIVDESHLLSSVDSNRTQAVLAKGGIAHNVKRAFYLTGTPVPNYSNSLWQLLYTYGLTTLNYNAFVKKFCLTYSFNGQDVVCGERRENMPELKKILSSVMLRRKKGDVLKEIPKVRVSELYLEAEMDGLTPELQSQFRTLDERINSGMTEGLDQLAVLEMCAQSVSSLRRFCVMKKIKPACELVESELENRAYEKIIIFCIHREAVRETERRLSRYGAVSIYGEISTEQRQKNIDLFQNDPRCRVIAINIAAGGTNITLTAADEILFLEQDYVPGNNAQAIARADRIGQKNSVNVRIAMLANSMDEKVQMILIQKLRGISELLG